MAPIRKAVLRARAIVPTPPLHRDWRRILRKAWSSNLMLLAMALSGAESVLPLFANTTPLPAWAFAAVTFVVVGAALWARLTVQKNMGSE